MWRVASFHSANKNSQQRSRKKKELNSRFVAISIYNIYMDLDTKRIPPRSESYISCNTRTKKIRKTKNDTKTQTRRRKQRTIREKKGGEKKSTWAGAPRVKTPKKHLYVVLLNGTSEIIDARFPLPPLPLYNRA